MISSIELFYCCLKRWNAYDYYGQRKRSGERSSRCIFAACSCAHQSKVAVLVYKVLHGWAVSYLGPSMTLPTFQVAEGFALPVATASFSIRFTVPLLAAEHFRLLAPRCRTACHRRLRRHRLWWLSALDSRRFRSLSHILTFGWSDTFVSKHCL